MTETIVQISDLHFGTVVQNVAEALITKINEIKPTLLVVSGDITQRSFDHQFKEAQEFLDRIDCKNRVIVPGNHDIPFYKFWHRLYKPAKNFAKFMGNYGRYTYLGDNVAVFGLNSCNPKHYKNGHFTHKHSSAMTRFFSGVPEGVKRILVCHHPVDVVLDEDMENIMPKSKVAVEHFEALNIDLVMAGHIHFPFCRSLKERYTWLEKDIWVCQAGTATSHRVRSGKPNSFMVVRAEKEQHEMLVEQIDYDDGHKSFMQKETFRPFYF